MAKGYLIGQVEITNIKNYKKYAQVVPEIVKKFGGKYLVRGGKVNNLEGETIGSRNVIMEFESSEDAEKFYFSPDYQSIINIRKNNSNSSVKIVEGV